MKREASLSSILLIDSDAAVGQAFSRALNDLAAVEVVSDVDLALMRIQAERFSLVVLDLDLEEQGKSAVERIRDLDPLIQIIVTAGTPQLSTILRALELGANDFITKSLVSDQDLRSIVQFSLEKLQRWQGAIKEAFHGAR